MPSIRLANRFDEIDSGTVPDLGEGPRPPSGGGGGALILSKKLKQMTEGRKAGRASKSNNKSSNANSTCHVAKISGVAEKYENTKNIQRTTYVEKRIVELECRDFGLKDRDDCSLFGCFRPRLIPVLQTACAFLTEQNCSLA